MKYFARLFCLIACLTAFALPGFAQAAEEDTGSWWDVFSPTPTNTNAPTQNTNPFLNNPEGGLIRVGSTPGLDQYAGQDASNPVLLVARLIRIALSFVGIGLVGLLVYAGYLWMTAAGEDEKITQSKSTMKNAVIGLIIIMMALTLSSFIILRLEVATRSYGHGG